jgi:hypothetical protein
MRLPTLCDVDYPITFGDQSESAVLKTAFQEDYDPQRAWHQASAMLSYIRLTRRGSLKQSLLCRVMVQHSSPVCGDFGLGGYMQIDISWSLGWRLSKQNPIGSVEEKKVATRHVYEAPRCLHCRAMHLGILAVPKDLETLLARSDYSHAGTCSQWCFRPHKRTGRRNKHRALPERDGERSVANVTKVESGNLPRAK